MRFVKKRNELPIMTQKKSTYFKPMAIMLILAGIFFGGIFLYKGFVSYMIRKSMHAKGIPPVAVSAITVAYESWQPTITATGTIRAVKGVDVTTEITGLVKEIPMNSGKEVKKGDILVELNASTELALLAALEAQAQLAEVTYQRDKAQYAIQAVSKAVLDADEANLKDKSAQVIHQSSIVAKKTIRAPFDGRLGIININLGQYLNPGDKIVTLQSLDPIYVDFALAQQEFPEIKENQPITFITDTYSAETFTGKINAINSKVDPITRTVAVEAILTNPDRKLLPGMYGLVNLMISSSKEYLTLPQTAISYNPYGEFVYILKEKGKDSSGKPLFVANQKFVTLGNTRGDQVQIVNGLSKGDVIVTSGQLKLKNGSVVFINNKVVPTNNPNSDPKVRETAHE